MYLLKMYINLEPGIRKLSIPTITDTIIQQVTVKKKNQYVNTVLVSIVMVSDQVEVMKRKCLNF